MNVLVIVDMQHRFPAARDLDLVARIEAALAVVGSGSSPYDRAVILCYDDSGMHTVRFPHTSVPVVWKKEDDGGDVLYAYLVGANLIDRELRVFIGGCNVGACVYRTACGVGNRLAEEHGITNAVTILRELSGDEGPFVVRFE